MEKIWRPWDSEIHSMMRGHVWCDRKNMKFWVMVLWWDMMNSDDDPFLKLHNWSIILQKHWPVKDWCFWHSNQWGCFLHLLWRTSSCYATVADERRGWNWRVVWHSVVTFTLNHFSLFKWWLTLNIDINNIIKFCVYDWQGPFHPLLLLHILN